MKLVLQLAVVGMTLALCVWLVADYTEIGLALFTLSPGHGVHLGDAIFAIGALIVFGCVAWRLGR